MTSFMLTLVNQANLGFKFGKGFKNISINVVARAISERFNLVVSGTHINNCLRHVRKIRLIIKKIKSVSGVLWDGCGEKNNYGKEGIPNICTSSKLEFMVNILCNICALTLIIECIFMFEGTPRQRDITN